MPSNTLITATGLTKEALRLLHNNIVFLKNVNKQYSDEFANRGAKVGSTVNVRMPNRYFVSHTTTLQAQNTNEETTPLQLTTPFQIGLNFTQQDLTLSLDDFSKRILAPAMARLASDMDQYALSMALDVWNQVGTPGTTPGSGTGGSGLLQYTVPNIFLNAGAVLDINAAPRDENRRVVMNPFGMAGSVGGLSGLMNDSGLIAEQYRKGVIGNALGFEFATDQNVNTLTLGTRTGTAANFKVKTTSPGAGTTTLTAYWSDGSGTIKKGEIFTIAGVNSVNPENQTDTGQLQYFVATADATVDATSFTISVAPAIKLAAAGVADGTVAALPTAEAQITLQSGPTPATPGTDAGKTYPLNLAYHQDAFTFATADLEKPNGVDFAAREEYEGISMLIVRAYDINNAQFPCRVDVLGGWKTLRGELACRIAG